APRSLLTRPEARRSLDDGLPVPRIPHRRRLVSQVTGGGVIDSAGMLAALRAWRRSAGIRRREPEMDESTVTAVGVTLDCRDPDALATCWMAAVGFAVRTGDGEPYVTLSEAPMRRPLNPLTLQRVPEPKSV